MKSRMLLLIAVVALLCAGNAWSAESWAHYWKYTAPAPSGNDWGTAGNWSTGVVPTTANTGYAAYQLVGGGDLMVISGYAECDALITGGWGGTDYTEVQSGAYLYLDNLDATGGAGGSGALFLGEATPETSAPCVFTNNGGDIYVTGQVMVGGSGGTGNASYVQNAGTFTSGWRLWISAEDDVQLNAGTMTVGFLQIDSTAVLDITGDLVSSAHLWIGVGGFDPNNIEAEAVALVQSYMADNRLTANDGAGSIQYEFDNDAVMMHVWAIPEPATMIMLALGGLLVSRKRK
jgi:hypothetical protein